MLYGPHLHRQFQGHTRFSIRVQETRSDGTGVSMSQAHWKVLPNEVALMDYWGKKYTATIFKVGNGSKQFGVHVWFNNQRVGLEMHFWVWELQIMRERKR